MEFITLAHPEQKNSARLKRQAHSHAARVAHARARKVRMADYQQSAAIDRRPSGEATSQSEDAEIRRRTKQNVDNSRAVTAALLGISGAFEHEPLASFIQSLTPREHFVFSHCTL
jgi:hypothetical protein